MSVNGPEDGPPHRLPIAISDVGRGHVPRLRPARRAGGAPSHRRRASMSRPRCWKRRRRSASTRRRTISPPAAPAAHRPAHRGSSPYQVLRHRGRLHHDRRLAAEVLRGAVRPARPAGADGRSALRSQRRSRGAQRCAGRAAGAEAAAQPSAHWLAELEAAGIPAGPVLHFDEVFTDPQMLARDMVAETRASGRPAPFRTLGVPVKLSDTPGAVRRPAPRLGEHTAERAGSAGG